MGVKDLVLSPSQIKTWDPHEGGCNRKWAFHYVLHVPEPEKKGTAVGTSVHKQFEHYLNGEALDFSVPHMRTAGEIAIPGFDNLPPPLSPLMLVERPFSFTLGGISYRGVKDVEVPDSAVIPGCEGGVPGVIDHKSTKAARYVKSVPELLVDVQSNVYAYHSMEKYRTGAVDVVYNYVFTTGTPRTQRVGLRMYKERVDQEMARVQGVAAEISVAHAAQAQPLTLQPNLAACDSYGGCPYKSLCTDLHCGPLGHLNDTEETMSIELFAKLAATNAAEDKAAVAPPLFAAQTVSTTPIAPFAAINPPESALPPAPAPVAVPVETPPPKKATKAKAEPAPTGFTLYLDCAPLKKPVKDASELYAQVNAALKEDQGVLTYRQIKFEGPGLFVAGFVKLFEAAPCDIYVDTRTAEGLLVLEVLKARAAEVIQ